MDENVTIPAWWKPLDWEWPSGYACTIIGLCPGECHARVRFVDTGVEDHVEFRDLILKGET